jgi:hypothetical protein
MLKKALTALVLFPFAAGTLIAQGPNTTMAMICSTSDGTVRITDRDITIADYRLVFDSVIRTGVLRFVDTGSGATAILDARDDRGLYLELHEGGQTMQVVAARGDIRTETNERAGEPASSSFSSVITLINAHNATR